MEKAGSGRARSCRTRRADTARCRHAGCPAADQRESGPACRRRPWPIPGTARSPAAGSPPRPPTAARGLGGLSQGQLPGRHVAVIDRARRHQRGVRQAEPAGLVLRVRPGPGPGTPARERRSRAPRCRPVAAPAVPVRPSRRKYTTMKSRRRPRRAAWCRPGAGQRGPGRGIIDRRGRDREVLGAGVVQDE